MSEEMKGRTRRPSVEVEADLRRRLRRIEWKDVSAAIKKLGAAENLLIEAADIASVKRPKEAQAIMNAAEYTKNVCDDLRKAMIEESAE